MSAVRRCALAWALGTALSISTATAQDNPDTQAWAQVLAIGQVSEHWRTHVEVQPRFMNGPSELGLTIVRTAVGRRVAPRASVWLGHAWVPRTLGTGTRHEQRLWQQLLVTPPAVGGWAPTARLRVEQRWLEPWQGTSHRVRVLTRAQRPLGRRTPWSVFAYDEAMFTIDRTPRGPARGYDRNRLSAGLAHRASPIVSTDIGYIWENAVIPGGRRNDHVFIAVLNLAVPR